MFAAVGYASVQAKVRARRSELLDRSTWRRLIDASDEDRALDQLALSPHLPAGEDPRTAQRALRRRVHHETLDLADDVPRRAGDLVRWYAGRVRVHDLKRLLRALHYGHQITEARETLVLDPEGDASVRDWLTARSVPELIGAVGDDLYGRALANAFDRYRAEDRTFYLEVALDLAFGRGLVARIEALHGGDRADAERLLGRWLARENLLAAARYRTLAGIRPEQVVGFCLHKAFGGGLAPVQRIAAGGPLVAEAPAVDLQLDPDLRGEAAIRAFEREADAVRRRDAEARFGRGPFGLGLPLAYLIVREAEVADLVTVLEAKLQGLSPDVLARRLPREVT